MYYFNARWYDPTLGRFITEDPARSGSSWYAYCNNNPLGFIDPSGLDPITSPNYKRDPSGEHQVLKGMASDYFKNNDNLSNVLHRTLNPNWIPGVVQWQYDNPKAAAEIEGISREWAEQPLQWIGLADTVTAAASGAVYKPSASPVVMAPGEPALPPEAIGPWQGPTNYSGIKNPSNVGASTKPTPRQVAQMKAANMAQNDGILRDDVTGEIMIDSAKSRSGVVPPANEAQVDHILPVNKGGTRDMSNLQLRTRNNNRIKSDN